MREKMRSAMFKVLDTAHALPDKYNAMSEHEYLDARVDEALEWLFDLWHLTTTFDMENGEEE